MEERSTRVYHQKPLFSPEELTRRESLCIHGEPAYCVAACPVKLDAKALAAAVAVGDFSGALALYEKVTPLVHLLSSGCEAPCQSKCPLKDAGDGVAIRALEAAAAAHGTRRKGRGLLMFKKKKTAAVFGASLFCAFVAGELARKAYPLTVCCAEPDAATFLSAAWAYPDPEGLRADAEALRALDITFRFGTDLTAEFFETERRKYDLIFLAPALREVFLPDAEPDGVTLLCPGENLLSPPAGAQGVLDAALAAKRAALTADRLAQKLDPRSSRGEEGAVATALITNLSGACPAPRVKAAGAVYTQEEAVREAGRCIRCGCEECARGCAYLRHYGKFPRQLTREIYNNVGIIMGDHTMNRPINSCALCGQCAVVCPNGYDLGEICQMARRNMVATEKMPLAPHEFALLDQSFSNTEAFLCRPQPGFETCRYVFFPGCQAAAVAPETVRAAWLDLSSRLSGGVGLVLGCCGAISDWAGRETLSDETAAFLRGQLARLGNPTVIAGCPTCHKTLARLQYPMTGIWDVLEKIGLPEGAERLERPVAVHDACGARGEPGTQRAVRRIAEQLGCTVLDLPGSGDGAGCCGYGGLVQYANPEVAGKMARACLPEGDAVCLSYCMACRDRFAREERESRHLLELVYGTDAGAPPDISEKRYNRLSLKHRLLREVWGEETEEMSCGFPVEFTPGALGEMDRRMILKSDVTQVLESVRETGEAVADADTGLLIARRRVGNVTFWVKYEKRDGRYLVRGAYSHRMQVEPRR